MMSCQVRRELDAIGNDERKAEARLEALHSLPPRYG